VLAKLHLELAKLHLESAELHLGSFTCLYTISNDL
jgi:hypothetical protein